MGGHLQGQMQIFFGGQCIIAVHWYVVARPQKSRMLIISSQKVQLAGECCLNMGTLDPVLIYPHLTLTRLTTSFLGSFVGTQREQVINLTNEEDLREVAAMWKMMELNLISNGSQF